MSDQKKAARILLVDDHPLVRESLTSLIGQQEDMVVCGEAEDAAGAMREIAARQPDIAIIDISLKGASGLELIKAAKSKAPDMLIIVLSMHDEKLYAERCIRAGALGYVMKGESTRRIIGAIQKVRLGKMCVSEAIAASFAEKFVGSRQLSEGAPIHNLSDRELEVFHLLGRGLGTRLVAESLHVSIKTVQAYCSRIKQKLGLSTATELLREAVRWNEQQLGNGADSLL